jgi:hypothetical protein
MSNQSDRVKRWRFNFKKRIIEAMGGACCICNYSKCQAALVCHHLDPSQKEFRLAKARATHKGWAIVVAELRKCVLLCHNCHSEVHSNIVSVPDDAPRFNEAYSNFKKIKEENSDKENLLDPCPICGTLKPIDKINCSVQCSGKSRCKVERPSKEQLYKEVWEMSTIKVAEKYGVSDNAVKKWCKIYGIEKPGIGYWNKLYAAKK